MTAAQLGTWRHPPLTYVVAELTYSPYYSLSDRIPGLQDRLRGQFPRTVEAAELLIENPARPTTMPQWQLFCADSKRGIRIGTRSLSLHATVYENSEEFLDRWALVVQAAVDAGLDAFVEHSALRYIDLVVPNGEKKPQDYFVQGLRGVDLSDARHLGTIWAAIFQINENAVNVRVASPAPEGMLLPPDFAPLPLAKPELMQRAEERARTSQPVGFVDTLCTREVRTSIKTFDCVANFTSMHEAASRAFSALLSETGRSEWV